MVQPLASRDRSGIAASSQTQRCSSSCRGSGLRGNRLDTLERSINLESDLPDGWPF